MDESVKISLKNHEDRIGNLETLYKPVSRLTTLLIINVLILTLILGFSGFLFNRMDSFQMKILEKLSSNGEAHIIIQKDIESIQQKLIKLSRQGAYSQELLKGTK